MPLSLSVPFARTMSFYMASVSVSPCMIFMVARGFIFLELEVSRSMSVATVHAVGEDSEIVQRVCENYSHTRNGK